jgi:hypothetical protein
MDRYVVVVVVVRGAVDVDDAANEVEDPVLGEAGLGVQTSFEPQVTRSRRVGDLDDEVDRSKQGRIEPEPRCEARNEGASAEVYWTYSGSATSHPAMSDEVTPHRAWIRAKAFLFRQEVGAML